jgi:hypothetical protein
MTVNTISMNNVWFIKAYVLLAIIVMASSGCELLRSPTSSQEEFRFPLAVGNKWVYAYSGLGRRGTETWEIVRQQEFANRTVFGLRVIGRGMEQNTPYFYQRDTTIVRTSEYILLPGRLVLYAPLDSVPRYLRQQQDTVRLGNPSYRFSMYVQGIGMVYYGARGGSPGSGYWSASLELQSYSVQR